MRSYPIGFPNRWDTIAQNFKSEHSLTKDEIIKRAKGVMRRKKLNMFKSPMEEKKVQHPRSHDFPA